VGSELVRQLAAGGAPVRAFVRDRTRAHGVPSRLGVEHALGDLSEPQTVRQAARGCAALFLLTPDGPQQVQQATAAAQAAAEAGVGHIVTLSSSDCAHDAPFAWAQAHYAIERHVESLGVHYTHLRAHYFMPNLLDTLQFESGSLVLRLPMGRGSISAVDVRDIAACAAAVLARGPLGRPAVLTGGESFTLAEAAAVLAEHSGVPVRYDDEDPKQHLDSMLARGVERAEAESIAVLYELGRSGYLDRVTGEVEALTGRPPRRLGAFAAEVAAPVLRDRYQEPVR